MKKTAVFIDGFNLYYGVLKNSPHKWLNIHALFSEILRIQNPENRLVRCAYYTAMVKGSLASRGQLAVQAQQRYHKALQSSYTEDVELIVSDHQIERKPLPVSEAGERPNKANRVMVWAIEEKQTDVRIALDAYRAGISGAIDQLVLVTNDTDLIPLLRAIKLDAPKVEIGLIIPRNRTAARPASAKLTRLAAWTRSYIRDEELANSQFPDRVPTRKKPVDRPDYW